MESVPLFARYGFSRTDDAEAPLEVRPYPGVCAHGALRATVAASAIDIVGGFVTRELAGSDAIFTTDLSLRILHPSIPKRLVARRRRLREGRRLVTTGVELESNEGRYGYGETTFMRVGRSAPAKDPQALATPDVIPFHPLAKPLDEEVGIESLGFEPGELHLPLRPQLLNPEGVMQGALVALLVECAATEFSEAAAGCPQVVSALDLRYLSGASVGPVRASAHWLGSPEQRQIRVETRDLGRADRLTASALVGVVDAPGD